MEFKRYPHVENTGRDEVEGIEIGTTFIFPKLDGANASVWLEDYFEIKCGSRNRELENPGDLQGFYDNVQRDAKLKWFLKDNFYYRLYGEWLVPHTLRTYQDDAWRKFYIFDVYDESGECFVPYNRYKPLLEAAGLEYIPCIKEIKNGETTQFLDIVTRLNTFLIKDSEGVGEGIVIKNYQFQNKYGRQCFAKLKTNDFVAKHNREMGHPVTEGHPVEAEIVDTLLTTDCIQKVYARLCRLEEGFSSRSIPRLLETTWHDFICEEIYQICKVFRNPTVDFKQLKKYVYARTKSELGEVFGGELLNKGY